MTRFKWIWGLIALVYVTTDCWAQYHPLIARRHASSNTMDDVPPPGMTSLTFVFDRTGSMNDDLVQVRHGAKGIFETVMKQRKKLIYNYVLVLFHDPDVDPPFISTDPDVFQQELASVTVQGGGDCPEMTLSGIKKALEVSLPGSYIYVFTDARAKDYHLEERVLNLIQERQSSVVFVMTGDCGNQTSPGYRVFERIAAASFGQVFHLEKSHVNTVLEYVRQAVQQKKIHLLYEVREHGNAHISPIAVDGAMTELTISLSGQRDDSDYLNISLIDPEGDAVDRSRYEHQEGTIDLRNVKLIRVSNPEPGMWQVRTTAKSMHTLRVFGHSGIDFKFGFSTRVAGSIDLAHPRPIANQLTYLMINMTGLEPPGMLMQVTLLDYHGRTLYKNETTIHPANPYLYYVGPFMPPKGFFFIRIQGEDDTNYEFVRISPTAISTVDATGPRAYMAERTTATAYQAVNLSCSIESVAPYTVYWKHGNNQIGGPLFYRHTDTSVWTIDVVSPHNRGYYLCEVVSENGNFTARTYLDTKEPPPHIIQPRNESVTMGQPAFLHCQTQSIEQASIVWLRKGLVVGNSGKVYQSPNGTLRILDASHVDSGEYICRATTSGGTAEARVSLQVYDKPQVVVEPKELFVVPNSDITLRCTVRGVPLPLAVWHFKGAKIENDDNHYVTYDNELIIRNVGQAAIGTYECRASNPAGIAVDYTTVKFAERPVIHVTQNRHMVSRGTSVVLDCRVITGNPVPTIKWYKDSRPVWPNQNIAIEGGRLTIQHSLDSDAGLFTCKAENMAGEDSKSVTVTIGHSPSIVPSPEQMSANIEQSITLQCRVVGTPKPMITWLKDQKAIDVTSSRFTVLPDDSLVIHNVQVEDQGYYTCKADNEFGQQQRNTLVIVTGLVSPILAQAPKDAHLIEGQDLRLGCVVLMGTPKPKVQWLKDGRPLAESENELFEPDGSLILKGGTEEQQGHYTCVAISPAGNATLSIDVQLIMRPIVVDEYAPREVKVRSGDQLDLRCPISSSTATKIVWEENGEVITGNTNSHTILPDNTLRIHKTDQIHAGVYTCKATNEAGEVAYNVNVEIQTAPVITSGRSSYELILGDTVNLDCDVESDPPADKTWYFNDIELETPNIDEYGALVLESVDENNRGTYKCIAKNDIGQDERSILVTVHIAPQIDKSKLIRAKNAKVNETVVLECPARAFPPPERNWTYEDTRLDRNSLDSSVMKISNDGSLILYKVQLSHAGNYKCQVSNLAGNDNITYSLQVQSPAKILTQLPEKTKVIAGIPYTLNCKVSGTPEPSLVWEKDGVVISGEASSYVITHSGALRIKNPTAGDSGVYKCSARNIAGEQSVETMVEVKSPPVVKPNQKSKYQLLEDQPGYIHCYVDAIPQPKIEWYMDNKPIVNSNEVIVLSNGTLYLTRVSKHNSGLFSCVAINEAGRTDALITVDVLEKPTIKKDLITDEQFVINDQPVVLHCPVTSNPVPQIQWLAHGHPVNRSSPHYVISDDGRRLSILHTNVKDSGKFECIASNAAGEVRKDFAIEVMISPHLDETVQKRKITVIQGNRVEIHCPVHGHPKPNITWLATLGSSSNFKQQQGLQEDIEDALVIEKVGLSNSGPYVCVASNKAGSIDVTVDLIVLAPPKIVRSDPPKVVISKPFTLNCDVENEDGTTIFKWLFNGRESLPSNAQIPLNGRRLIISRATEENNGVYTCVAINQVDEDTQDFSVEVNVPPTLIDKTPYDDTITIVEGQKQVLRCDVRGNPPPQIQWFRDEHLIPGTENRTSIEVEPIDETVDKNHYSCVIKNNAGLATKDFFVQSIFTPKMAQLTQQQRAVDAYEGNTATFECPVSSLRLEDLEINWLQKGRPIILDSKRYSLSLDRTRLTILGIHLGDEGEYTCVISNKAGKVTSQFELNVLVPPNILGSNFEAMEFVEDKSLHLECIYNGFPTPKVIWTKDGGKLPAEAKVMTESRFLHIEKILPAHAGIYACNVENDAGKVIKTHNVTIIRRPQLLLGQHSLQDHSVAQSKSTVLECAIHNEPGSSGETEVIWLKDGVLLKAEVGQKFKFMENGRKLFLTDVEVDDQGLYTCLVRNKAGEEKQEFQLDVKTKPEILSPSREFTIIENGSLTMVCESNAKPKPTITWLKNGVKLMENDKINIKSDGEQLKLSKLDPSDAGHYICRAENELGAAETSFGVVIIQKPALMDVKSDKIDAPLGDSISLNCPIKDPSFIGNISWLYNMKPIDSTAAKFTVLHNGRKLIVHDANLQDQGTYTCVVKNLAGENRADYTLDIMVPPSIEMLERDRRRTVIENGTLVLECAANGNPEPVIRWYRDGQKLDHSNVAILIPGAKFAGTSLRLENIKANSGSGRYTCEAQNAAGIVDEDITVEVMTKPRIQRLNQPADLDGEIGGRVEIHCPVLGTPSPYVTWLRDGTPLNAAPHSNQIYVSHNQQRLNFVNLQREHAATYTCVAKNAAGNDTRDFRLRFLEEPSIDESNIPPEHTFTINSTIVVACPAEGRPEPTIAWLRDGVPLGVADAIAAKGQDERVMLLNGGKELRIDKARLADAGRYTCVATNIAGIADMDTFVKIMDIPRFDGKTTSSTHNVASLLNKPAVLECKVNNWDESMEIEWRKDGRTISGAKGVVEGIDEEYVQITDHGRKLHILSAQKSDAVQWSCIVKNRAGSVQQNFRLEILIKPTMDEKNSSPPLITALQKDRIEIHCAVNAIPKATVIWRKNGRDLEPNSAELRDQNRTLVISNAQEEDEGRYSCEAENIVGKSTKTFMLLLSSPPLLDTPNDVIKVQKNQAVVLNCEPKSGNSPFTTEWYRNKELLMENTVDIVIDNTNLVINNAQQEHAGDYYCVVSNSAGQAKKTFKVTVLQRPKFMDLSSITPALIFNHSLILDCKVEGLPPPIVLWKKDGQNLVFESNEERQFLNNNQQLYIDSAEIDDAGVYTCIGENDAGKATKNIVITMLDAPSVIVPFQDVEARENETITLTCPVNDPSLYRMTWLKDDAVVTNSPSVQVSENGHTLHFTKISSRNAGQYICEVANDAGETKATLNLAVLTTPHIQQPPPAMRNVAVRLEERLSLHCNADGEPKPEISWLFDGQVISSGQILVENTLATIENGNLVVLNVSTLNEGRYTCLAQNKAGRTEADVFVEVIVPPVLEVPQETIKVVQNKNLTIKARLVQGTEPLEVSWKKGDTEIATVSEAMEGGVFYLVKVQEVKPSDGGEYVIKVQNKGGVVTEKIKVEVLTPPIIIPGERVFKVVELTDLTLECQAEGSPNPKIKWYQNGKNLNRTSFKLALKNVTTQNEGRYTCEALNDAGSVSTEFSVEVYVRPKILEYEKVIKAIDGSKVRLECKFTGNPEPTVKWMRSGRPITNAPNIILSPRGETLLIPKAKKSDVGDYSCVVSNKAGQAEAPFSVLIQTAPHIDEAIDQNPTVVEGSQLVLECPVLGSPDPTVTWRYLENDISPSDTMVYIVEGTNLKVVNATVSQAGRYSCLAKNEIGELETNYELEVIAAPRFGNAVNKSYTVIEGNAIDIVCPVEANPTPTIEWLRNGVEIDFSSTKFHVSPNAKKLKLTNATLSDAGKYVCRASNVAGSNDIDLSLRVIVPPRIDESNVIRNPLAVLGRSIYLECPATAIPQPMIMWLKDGRPVDYEEMISDGKTKKFSLQQGNQTFGIREVEHSDRGAYTCFVQNQGGSASEDFDVDVLIPPVMDKEVTTTPQILTKRENESVVLTCPVKTSVLKNDVNDLSISWTQDGRPVDATSKNIEISSNGKRLTIKSIKVADGGHYKCVASNRAGQSHAKFHMDVLSQPVIIEEKINSAPTVPIGRSTVLWCPVSGHPPPTVKWFKGNGEQVKEIPGKIRLLERGQGLELIQAGLEDIGTWTCHAENDAGVTEKVITLNVYVEPQVEVRAQDTAVKPIGSSVTLFCNATGNPKPALAWNINGNLLIPSADTAQVSLSGTRLDIMNLQADNTGSYECVARNELGSAQAAVTVDILVTPEINRENLELNRRLITGRSVTLYCEAAGKPTPKIEWFLNGTLITDKNTTNIVFGTENKFIQISNATLDDKGVYECQAENGAGKDNLQYVITVDLSPSIVNSGTNKVVEGNVAVMECVATGEPKPKITWQRNGIRVETGQRYMVEERVLKIIDTHSSDSGIYVCVATNEAGTDQQAFTLEVLVSPEIIKKSPNETVVAVGSEISLVCESSAYPLANTSWYYMDEPVEESGINYTIKGNGNLIVSGLHEKGDLQFKCVVWNEAGEASSLYVVKAISAPATIGANQVRQVNSSQAQPTIITCEIEIEWEKSEVVWKKNGEPIKLGGEITAFVSNKKGQLQLGDTELTDEGEYECTVMNSVGNATQKTQLYVGVPPKINEKPMKVVVKKGERAKVWCETVGIPPPEITWNRDNVTITKEHLALDEDDILRLAIVYDNVQPSDAGIYTCTAKNWAGTAEKDVDLVVLTPPVIEPHQLNVNASLGDTIILPCNASGNPEPVISWMKVPNMTLIGKEDKYKNLGTSLAIQGVSIDDDDFYQCIARSDAGTATGVRRVTVNNIHLSGPPRVWVECDKEGHPTANAYVPPRGDVPTDIDPSDIEYLPWEERHLYNDKNASNIIYFKCFPTSRDPRHLVGSPVQSPPQFIETPPRLIQLAKGQPLKLKCSAAGMPAPIIVWSINGKIVDSSMDLLDLEAESVEEGRYVCTARNDVGEEHSIAKVEFIDEKAEVRRAPKKEAPPVPVTVLDCKNPAKEVSWYFDGERIEPMIPNDRLHVLANGSLVLNYFAEKEELAKFDCEVLVHGKEKKLRPKAPINLEIAEVAPVVEIPQPDRIVGQHGSQVVLDCKLVKGTALLTRIRWTKDNINLEVDGNKFVFASNNSLIINDLSEADRGSYKCRAWNRKGKSYDEAGLIVGNLAGVIEARIHGKINGRRIEPTNIVFARPRANVNSNDLTVNLENLPDPLGPNGTKAQNQLVGLMATPSMQLGYDPDRLQQDTNPMNVPFHRATEYKFKSGERMKVNQKSVEKPTPEKMKLDVEFDGDLPNIKDDDVTINPMEEDLVADKPNELIGQGKSSIRFGPNGEVPFTFNNKIKLDLEDDQEVLSPDMSMHLKTAVDPSVNQENPLRLGLQINTNRFGECPDGYVRIKDHCKDIDECALDTNVCGQAECRNTYGGFDCDVDCAEGFGADELGECVDVDECKLGMFDCDLGMECRNTNGTYDCAEACPDGYYMEHTGDCVDIDECQRSPCESPMECVNLGGDFQCVCPLGLELVDNGTRCEGLVPNIDEPLQAMTFDTTPDVFECPEGLEWTGTACADIDECAFDAPCQHKCSNRAGGFECFCPEGYILDEFGQCLDVNECEMEGVCGQGELCFNQLGDYSCIVNACPSEYRLRIESSDIATCLPLCKNCTTPIIHIYLFPLPQGLPKGTPLARLAAHDTKGKILRNTTFHEIRDISQPVPERQAVEVRVKDGRATLLLNDRLPAGTKQRLNLRSSSVSVDGSYKYASNFHIFTAISKFPF